MSYKLFLSCLLILSFQFNSISLLAQDDNSFTTVDVMPYFPGCNDFQGNPDGKRKCSDYNLVGFISTTLQYPKSAKDEGITGTVIVSFVVDKDGTVRNPSIVRDIGGGCGEAALAVINKMPRWEAGKQNKEKVNVKLNLPIKFSFAGQGTSTKHRLLWGEIKGNTISRKEIKSNLTNSIVVRDQFGETVAATETIVAYERKKKFLDSAGQKKLDDNQKRILKKARKGGIITFSVTIQEDGEFIEVDRAFTVIKNRKVVKTIAQEGS